MSYRTPEHREGPVQNVLRALDEAERVLLTTHMNADGDGAGCQAALASWLRNRGTEAWIVNPTPFPELFTFLLQEEDWVLKAGSAEAKRVAAQADLAVVLDTGEYSRIERVSSHLEDLSTVVVDHHPPGEDAIAGISFRDPTAAATGELVYDVLLAAGDTLAPVACDALYVALMTDTGCFRFSNSTAGAFRVAGDLVEAGVSPEELHRKVYGSHPLRRHRLLARSLEHLEVDDEGLVAWMTVPRDAYEELGATTEELDGFVDYPRSVEGVEVGVLFRALGDGSTKVSFRSTGKVDVNALAREFGGGGHVRAAGARVEAPVEKVRSEVLEKTRNRARAVRNPPDGEGVH